MRKIHLTEQFFKANGAQGHFFEKKKEIKRFKLQSRGMCVPNFRSESFSFEQRVIQNKYRHTDIQVKIRISLSACSPVVDFENGRGEWRYVF